MASIYLHIPFCRQMCGYCDFFKTARLDKLESTIAAMVEEIAKEREFITTRQLSTIYFGGGTPSLLAPRQIETLLEQIHRCYDTSRVNEITLEANPDDLSKEYLQALKNIGINRLSIGIQSFDDETLKFMNRRHSAAQALKAIEAARSVGFENIAIDLIFGVSGYGERQLTHSLEQAISLGVEHIAAYHLTIESGTPFALKVKRGEFSAVSEKTSEEEYEIVRQSLCAAGYNHYEISNYALPDRESRHNSAYWSGEEYLGIGAGAHSYSRTGDWGVRRWSEGGLARYLAEESGERYQVEMLTKQERRNEIVMTSLRRTKGLNITEFSELFGAAERDSLIADASKALQRGDLTLDKQSREESLRIPTDRFLRSDLIIEELFRV